MRKIIFFAVIFFPFIAHADLYNDRGFIENACYREFIQISRSERNCDLELFAMTNARISIRLLECPRKFSVNTWYWVQFQFVNGEKKGQYFAKLLTLNFIDADLANRLSYLSHGIAHKIVCTL